MSLATVNVRRLVLFLLSVASLLLAATSVGGIR
jgi:hypothetical protein